MSAGSYDGGKTRHTRESVLAAWVEHVAGLPENEKPTFRDGEDFRTLGTDDSSSPGELRQPRFLITGKLGTAVRAVAKNLCLQDEYVAAVVLQFRREVVGRIRLA